MAADGPSKMLGAKILEHSVPHRHVELVVGDAGPRETTSDGARHCVVNVDHPENVVAIGSVSKRTAR